MPPFRILLLFFLAYVTTTSACTLIIAGKNATSDGSVLIAHTDDAGGETSDLRLVQIPAARHEKDSKRAVLLVNGGFPRIVAKRRGWAYHPENPVNAGQNASEVLGYIDQVENTFAYIDQDYGMINEHQLIIGETTTGGQFCGWPKSRDYPWGKALFGIEELTKIALERCISARCAIETMGGLAVEFGFYSLESGNDPANPEIEYCSETLAIGDKFGEVGLLAEERAAGASPSKDSRSCYALGFDLESRLADAVFFPLSLI